MTRSAHDEAVEAAALVHFGQAAPRQTSTAEKIITSYLRHMRAEGVIQTRLPDAEEPVDAWQEGYNAALKDTLANAVEVPE